ncbi:hypothetical protein [Paracoccus lutimaris]|uniref:hypothetical protein n=1 Tax=Paracoccus lutimaris TaxID=1490030 RepID=UPI0015F01DCC|nr:hypothetical protein [Paracoccus lutimaris]
MHKLSKLLADALGCALVFALPALFYIVTPGYAVGFLVGLRVMRSLRDLQRR